MFYYRSWVAIKLKGVSLGLRRSFLERRESDMTSLLEETPEAYYWAGFLMADGFINHNTMRLRLHLAAKDRSQVERFCKFVNSEIKTNKFGSYTSLQDKSLMPLFIKKFDFRPSKTFNPPDMSLYASSEFFVSFVVGYIDGDGCIIKQFKRQSSTIRIKVHSEWFDALNNICDVISKATGLTLRPPKINNQGYASMIWCGPEVQLYLKSVASSLPSLARKWDVIDTSTLDGHELSANRKSECLRMRGDGLNQNAMAKYLGISKGRVSAIMQELRKERFDG